MFLIHLSHFPEVLKLPRGELKKNKKHSFEPQERPHLWCKPWGVALRPRTQGTVGDRCERAGREFLGQGGLHCPFATAAEALAQLRKCLALENKDEEQVDAVQGVEHAGESIQSVVACYPWDELKHPDDSHDN